MKKQLVGVLLVFIIAGFCTFLQHGCKKFEGVFGSLQDIEGNTYKTVEIGDQEWMAENLRSTRFNDGSPIPYVADSTAWSALSTPGFCWYENDSANTGSTFGVLYNGFAIRTGRLCPAGWRVPTETDWDELADYIGGAYHYGGKLKEEGTLHWQSPNVGADNNTGFSALPGGYRVGTNGRFNGLGVLGTWWASDSGSRSLSSLSSIISAGKTHITSGLSVRCMREL